MKLHHMGALLLSVGLVANASAAPKPQPPQDVTVVNNATNPLPVVIQDISGIEFEFVGPSTDPVTSPALGSQGITCRAAHGAEAKWATTKELVEAYESGAFATFPAIGTGWVARPIVTIGTGSSTYFDP